MTVNSPGWSPRGAGRLRLAQDAQVRVTARGDAPFVAEQVTAGDARRRRVRSVPLDSPSYAWMRTWRDRPYTDRSPERRCGERRPPR